MKVVVKENINLFAALAEESRVASGKHRNVIWMSIAMGGIILLFLAAGASLFLQNAALSNEAVSLESTVNNPNFSERYQEKLLTQNRLNAYMQYNKSCQEYMAQLESKKRLQSQTFEQLHGLLPAGTGISGYNFTENSMELACTADNEDSPAAYAKALADSGLFSGVQFSGFSSSGNDGQDYSFSITCMLWEEDSVPSETQ